MSIMARLHSIGFPMTLLEETRPTEKEFGLVNSFLKSNFRILVAENYSHETEALMLALGITCLEKKIKCYFCLEPPEIVNYNSVYIFPVYDPQYEYILRRIIIGSKIMVVTPKDLLPEDISKEFIMEVD